MATWSVMRCRRFLVHGVPSVARALLMGLLLLGARTDPVLSLTSVSATAGASVTLLRFEGSLRADDLVQHGYGLQLLVHQVGGKGRYVRYDVAVQAVVGTDARLTDGLNPDEAESLLLTGEGADAAGVVAISPGRIDVRLPASFPPGPAQAVAYAPAGEGVVLSNAIDLDIPGRMP